MPESEGLGVVALFDRVYQTGEPYYQPELEGWFDFQGNGQPEQFFVNLSLHPLRNTQGEVDGVLDFSYNVTEQVRARQQVQQLNQDLSVLNDELRAANEELHANNADLLLSEQALLALTHELEARVGQRTQALHAKQQQLEQLFMQAPAPIVILKGPKYVYQLVVPAALPRPSAAGKTRARSVAGISWHTDR
jgi:peptidoglycan hydrolase-like protein with peptidoglycan-binding domain